MGASDTAPPSGAGRSIKTLKEIFMKRFATPRAFATALVLSLGLAAGSGFAAPRGDHHRMGPHDPGAYRAHAQAPMFHFPRALYRLRDELKLDARQEALWKEAESFAREQRDAIRAHMPRNHAEIKALLDQPGSDLRAVARRLDELRGEGLKERDALRERWLAVYDSFGDEQKEKIRLFFKDGAERVERWVERAERPWRGRRHGPRQAPVTLPAPAPAPAP
jgi:hypothetical protein